METSHSPQSGGARRYVASMNRHIFVLIFLVFAGCSRSESVERRNSATSAEKEMATVHSTVDFDHWSSIFPVETFQKTSGPRQFSTMEKGDPLDLWKPGGAIITSPAHLCEIELVRKQYANTQDLGPPEKPFLTKLGGTPHRESTIPWPNDNRKPFTFVAQFCFADSRNIVSTKIAGDVMLIFFKDADSLYEDDSIHVEWSAVELDSPLTAGECPSPSFTVPQLSGHIYRTNEYPESLDVFEKAGHEQWPLFARTQSTKIGRETFFIQNDPRDPGNELLCALNSVHPTRYPPGIKWPFIGLETLPDDWNKPGDDYGWGKYRMMFADVGCIYFLIDKTGNVTWTWDSY